MEAMLFVFAHFLCLVLGNGRHILTTGNVTKAVIIENEITIKAGLVIKLDSFFGVFFFCS